MKKIIWNIIVAILVIIAVAGDIYMVNTSNNTMAQVQLLK